MTKSLCVKYFDFHFLAKVLLGVSWPVVLLSKSSRAGHFFCIGYKLIVFFGHFPSTIITVGFNYCFINPIEHCDVILLVGSLLYLLRIHIALFFLFKKRKDLLTSVVLLCNFLYKFEKQHLPSKN